MAALQRVVLELDADVDPNSSGKETGMFEMVGNLSLTETTATDYIMASGQGSAINAVLSGNVDAVSDLLNSDQEIRNRAGFYLDLGGGEHTFEIQFQGWDGATDSAGNALQWGDPDRPVGSPANATGEGPLTQMHCFNEYLRVGEFDSRYPHARLRVGEYSGGTAPDGSSYPDGLYDDYLQVTVKNNSVTRDVEDKAQYTGGLMLAEAKNLSAPVDAIGRVEW